MDGVSVLNNSVDAWGACCAEMHGQLLMVSGVHLLLALAG